MVVIRLALTGAKKRPFYHIVAADKRNPRGGKFIERLGYYNPIAKGGETEIMFDTERFDHWLSVGAQPSPRVNDLLKEFKDPEGTAKRQAKKSAKAKAAKEKAKKAAAVGEEEAKAAEAPAEEAKAEDK